MPNAFFSCRNLNKKNGLLAVNVMVLFLWKLRLLIRSSSSEIQFPAISSLSTTNSHLRLNLLVKRDLLTSRMYHIFYTQEFQLLFLDETVVFLKKSSIVRNTEEGHLAYSYPKKPYITTDVFAWQKQSYVS